MPFGFAAPEWRAKSPLRARDQVGASRQARFLFQLQLLALQTPELKLLLLPPTPDTYAAHGGVLGCELRVFAAALRPGN